MVMMGGESYHSTVTTGSVRDDRPIHTFTPSDGQFPTSANLPQ